MTILPDPIEQPSEIYLQRLSRREKSKYPAIWALLDQVKDPEIPVLSLWDLGVLNDIEYQNEKLIISITPTYSGCPAHHAMQQDIEQLLQAEGYEPFEVRTSLSPAWSSDSLSPQAHQALQEYGIAPPQSGAGKSGAIACPRCHSSDTQRVSEFGSTACKALYQCNRCLEPFDYFKCL